MKNCLTVCDQMVFQGLQNAILSRRTYTSLFIQGKILHTRFYSILTLENFKLLKTCAINLEDMIQINHICIHHSLGLYANLIQFSYNPALSRLVYQTIFSPNRINNHFPGGNCTFWNNCRHSSHIISSQVDDTGITWRGRDQGFTLGARNQC